MGNRRWDLSYRQVEKLFTKMTKSFMIPVLLAFYNEGNIKMEIDEDDIYRCYMKFYSMANNRNSSRIYIDIPVISCYT